MAKKIPNKHVGDYVTRRVPFEANSMVGSSVDFVPDSGRLSQENADMMASDKPSYVVKSYGTPIAWHGSNGWVVPNQKFSQTTSTHQNLIRRALNGEFVAGHSGARQ